MIGRHIAGRIAATPIDDDPFPHRYVTEIFPTEFYQSMMATRPVGAMRPFKDIHPVGKDYPQRFGAGFSDKDLAKLPADVRPFWRELGAQLLSDEFRDEVASVVAPDAMPSAWSEAYLLLDKTGLAVRPHTDAPTKTVTILFYLPDGDTQTRHGTSLYRPKDGSKGLTTKMNTPALFDRVKTVAFMPNTALVFARSGRSFHGREPIQDEEEGRWLLIWSARWS